MTTIHYSDNRAVESVIDVWEDLHEERSGFYRAFWVSKAEMEAGDVKSGSPVIGYCSPGGSHRTIAAVVAEVRKLGHTDPIYRKGKLIPNKCKSCNADEKINAFGYTNFALGGYCADCITRAYRALNPN